MPDRTCERDDCTALQVFTTDGRLVCLDGHEQDEQPIDGDNQE